MSDRTPPTEFTHEAGQMTGEGPYTPRTPTTAACTHEVIQTWGDGTTAVMWACADPDCRLRFYPACRECVDVGHRNVVHEAPAEPRAERLDVERLARALAKACPWHLANEHVPCAPNVAREYAALEEPTP